jgi:hypothetical protein
MAVNSIVGSQLWTYRADLFGLNLKHFLFFDQFSLNQVTNFVKIYLRFKKNRQTKKNCFYFTLFGDVYFVIFLFYYLVLI